MKSQILYPKSNKRILIHPVSSLSFTALIYSFHGTAFLFLFFINLNMLLLLTAAGLIFYSSYRFFLSEKLNSHGLSLQLGETLLFQINKSSNWQNVEVLESFVTRWIIVLKIRTLLDLKEHSLVYAVDSINSQNFRRLIVYLNSYHARE